MTRLCRTMDAMSAPNDFGAMHGESDLASPEIASFAGIKVVVESNDRDTRHIASSSSSTAPTPVLNDGNREDVSGTENLAEGVRCPICASN